MNFFEVGLVIEEKVSTSTMAIQQYGISNKAFFIFLMLYVTLKIKHRTSLNLSEQPIMRNS